MSQKKVEQYKSEKRNRKEALRKARRASLIRRMIGTLVGLALVAWIGYSVIDNYQSNLPRQEVVVDYSALNDYLETLGVQEE